MDIAELYRIIYYGPDDHLWGAILVCDEPTGFQFLFKDKSLDTCDPKELFSKFFPIEKQVKAYKESNPKSHPLIKSGGHILLTGPSEASIGFMPDFSLSFFLFGDIQRSLTIVGPPDSEDLFVPLERDFRTDDGTRLVTVLYALFERAVEAHVKVKIINVTSAFDLYGVIAARTSAIQDPAYSSILFFKGEDEKLKVKPTNGDYELPIHLSRSIVGVPFGSSLVLQFGLVSDGRSDKLVEHHEHIEVTEDETSSKTVRYLNCHKNCVIVAEINWRKLRECKP